MCRVRREVPTVDRSCDNVLAARAYLKRVKDEYRYVTLVENEKTMRNTFPMATLSSQALIQICNTYLHVHRCGMS
jgi:hypothetical protein